MTTPSPSAGDVAKLVEERDEARQIVRDIYWMALRYADGRQTYAPGMCNDALRKAYDGGWLIHRHQSDPAFARDGSSPEYRGLEAENARLSRELAEARAVSDQAVGRLDDFIAERAWPLETEDQVEALARECGWNNRRYMTAADYTWWCEHMRMFARLAQLPARSVLPQKEAASNE